MTGILYGPAKVLLFVRSGIRTKFFMAGRIVMGLFFYALCTFVFIGSASAQTCASPTGTAGDMLYNDDYHVLQYCNGSTWKPVGASASLAGAAVGPSSCPNIGQLCADGTIYAGYHPVFKVPVFIPPTNQGANMTWRSSGSGADIATDSWVDGRANTNQVANSTTFPPFKACKDLTLGGYTDWYLPSIAEMEYLYMVRLILATGPHTDFTLSSYWSSTEIDNSAAYSHSFNVPDGSVNGSGKNGSFRVRCMRR